MVYTWSVVTKSTFGCTESTNVTLLDWLILNSTCSVNYRKSRNGINLSS
jgi:hypothetical protein